MAPFTGERFEIGIDVASEGTPGGTLHGCVIEMYEIDSIILVLDVALHGCVD